MTRSHQRTSESHDPAHAIRRQARKGPWRVERGQFHIPTADGEQVILSGAAVAGLLDVDERIVRRGCEDGQIPSIRVGRRLLVVREKSLAMLTAFEGPDGLA
jgi:hypothetical protein